MTLSDLANSQWHEASRGLSATVELLVRMGVHFISMKMEFILKKYYTCTTRARLFNRYTCCKIYLNAVTRYRASLCALRGAVNERNNFVFNITFLALAATLPHNYGRPLSVSGRPCYILPMFFYLFIYFYGRLILRPWLTEVRENFTRGRPWVSLEKLGLGFFPGHP